MTVEEKTSSLYSDPAKRITVIGMGCNAILIVAKLWGGIMGHSTALVADAFHSISDIASDLVVLYGLKIGEKGPDKDHHFGHGKIETMATFSMGVLIILVGIGIGVKSAIKIQCAEIERPEVIVIMIAFLSMVTKEVLYHFTRRTGEKLKRPILVSNAWHHRSDALSSLTVLIGAAGTRLEPNWVFLDAYAAIVVSLLIIKSGTGILIQSTKDILDTVPDPAIVNDISRICTGVPGVKEVVEIKVRPSGRFLLANISIAVDPEIAVSDACTITREVKRAVKTNYPELLDITVSIEAAR